MAIKSPSQDIVVQRLEESDLDDIVAIHQRVLGYTLNSQLGQGHLRRLYSAMLNNPDCFVAIARHNSKSIGFVSGTLNVESTKSRFLRSTTFIDLLKIALHLLLHPRLLLDVWYGIQIEKPVEYDNTAVLPTLTTIGVEERFQGSGAGRELVRALEEFFRLREVPVFRLDTLLSNQKARAFYARLGFFEVAERANSVILIKSLADHP